MLGRSLALFALAACASGAGGAFESPVSPGAPTPAAPAPPPDAAATPDAGQALPDAGEPSRSLEVGGWVEGGRPSTFELAAREGEPVRVLRVVVGEVTNPERRNLSLVVTAVLPAAPSSAEGLLIGRLTFYPANQGGTFVLPLPAPALAQLDAQRVLGVHCALEVEGGEGLESMRVQLRALTLAPAP